MRMLVTTLMVLCVTAAASAQSITERGDRALDVYRFTDASQPLTLADSRLPTTPPVGAPEAVDFKTKSVAKAFVYSLLIPGAGQFYTGSKLKGFIFLGVEALGWVAWASYQSSGDDQTAEYEAFAREHWSDVPYWDSLKAIRNIDKWHDDDVFAHHLPWKILENGDTVANQNYEYYENVGKYDQFVWGWDDLQQIESPYNKTSPELSFTSAHRYEYVAMREDANQAYDHARAAGIVLIANHLVSAVEAAFAAKRHNGQNEHASAIDVKVNLVNLEDTPTPWVRVAYRF
jgi:hypothetical protein